MVAAFSFLLKLEVNELVFGNHAEEVVCQQDQREQQEEKCRAPGRYFEIIMFLDEQEDDQKHAEPHFDMVHRRLQWLGEREARHFLQNQE